MLLLRGALTEGPGAVIAAEEWLRSQDAASSGLGFQGLESGSRRLLPLLYQNVKASISKELGNGLKEVYLEYWAKNQRTFNWLEKLLVWFQANAIPTLVLKGAALSILHYRNAAVRPISDVDVLVREEQVSDIIERLRTEGWESDYISANVPMDSYFYRHVHAIPFTHPEFGNLDLHWHVLQVATFRGADHLFWKDSVSLRLKTLETQALNASDQLLHACVHGFAGNVVAPIRWIADAVTVLRTGTVDWKRLLNLAREMRVTMPLAATLSFLEENFQVAIPAEVIGEIRSCRVPRADRRYFSRLAKPERPWREILAYNWERHRRARPDLHPIARLARLPRDLGSFAFYRLANWTNRGSTDA